MGKRRLALVAGLSLSLLLITSGAAAQSADSKRECAASYEQAQRSRRENRLLEAKRSLVACVQDRCPSVLRAECAGWLKEVEDGIPSVVVDVRDEAGETVTDVELGIDDAPLASRLDGKAIEIDPGVHVFRFRRRGEAVLEQSVVVTEGGKLQKVAVTLRGAHGPAVTPKADGERPPLAPDSSGSPRPIALPLTLAATGLVALGSFAFFGLSGRADERNTLEPCRPDCPHDKVAAVGTKYLVADVSLVVATVALGAAAIVWLTHAERARGR